ncbi:hypothetical protein RR48_01900 [Papilio machaon]|uniref:Uncharacterized protein n=1 Tax=Papilio machaon TaxID=76193 RepID=A0A0N1IPF5_PAPMA|nr:hypothetical protein RR48_01900 [Papilio machaon]
MSGVRSDIETDSSEEDVDSGIAEEMQAEPRKEVDCMELQDFFSYW